MLLPFSACNYEYNEIFKELTNEFSTQTQLKEEEVQRQVKMKKKEEEDDFAE